MNLRFTIIGNAVYWRWRDKLIHRMQIGEFTYWTTLNTEIDKPVNFNL